MMKKYIVFSFCLVSFFFRAEEISIEELVSVGSNINQSKDLISSTIDIIDSEELERQSEKDVLSVLSNTLAIDTSRYGGFGQISSVFLRGTNSNHTIFQVNGVKINPSTAGGASIYSLDADVISKIEIGSGAFSSIHGSEAIGGIVNISTIKQDIEDKVEIKAKLGQNKFKGESVSLNFNKEKTKFNLFASDTTTEGFPIFSDSTLNRGFTNKTVVASINQKKESSSTQFSSWSSKGRTEYLGFNQAPLSQYYNNEAHAMSVVLNNKKDYRFLVRINTFKDLILQEQENLYKDIDLTKTKRNTFEFIINKSFYSNSSFALGYSVEDETVKYSSFGTKFDQKLQTDSLLAEWNLWRRKEGAYFSFRNTHHETYGNQKAWKLSLIRLINNNYSLIVNSGTAFRSPNSSELYGYGANKLLLPETSRSYEILLKTSLENSSFSSVLFNNKTSNLINFDYNQNTLRNILQSSTKGAELRFRWKNRSINGRIILRLQQPIDGQGNLLIRRSKRSLGLNLFQTFNRNVLNFNFSAFGKRKDFSERSLPGYFLLNIALSRKVSDKLSLSCKIENLLNKEYFTAAGMNGYYLNQDRSIWFNIKYTFGR